MFHSSGFALKLALGFAACLVVLTPLQNANAQGPDATTPDTFENYCAVGVTCNPALSPARRYELGGPTAAFPEIELAQPVGESAEIEGSNDFGYVLNQSDTYSWIDATGGTNTGMQNYGYNQKVGPIALPFTFRFYEYNYDNVYIAAEGFLTFTPPATVPVQGQIPQVNAPNNLIAPYWAPFYLSGKGKKGKVYYSSGGTAPNRYFVVEWSAVPGGPATDPVAGNDLYTFEAILHENGDINFQYQKMNYSGNYYCGVAGIENSNGLQGIHSGEYCKTIKPNRSVRFMRPQPAGRVQVTPTQSGDFGAPGTSVDHHASIRNVGDLGPDTFSLGAVSSENWDAAIYAEDGVTPLTQVGPLAEGEAVNVIVRVQVPAAAQVGNDGVTHFHVGTTIGTGAHVEQTITTGVTADFAVAYHTFDDYAQHLHLVRNNVQTDIKVTPDNYYGTYPGLLRRADDSYIYAWIKQRCLTTNCSKLVQELEYTVRNQNGAQVVPIRQVRSLGNPGNTTYQFGYGMATASDGYSAFAWVQEEDKPNGTWKHNVVFATINPAGDHSASARTLTKNKLFGNDTTADVPFLFNARVVARPDNTFVVLWQQRTLIGGKWTSDIYYEILDHFSKVIKKATRFTNAKSNDGFYSPGAVALPNGQVFVGFTRLTGPKQDLWGGVLDSDGKTLVAPKQLVNDGMDDTSYVSVTHTTDGTILVAWTALFNGRPVVRYLMLDSTFSPLATPFTFETTSPLGDGASSLNADDDGNAVLVFHEYNSSYRHTLYHALIHPATPMMSALSPFRYSSTYITGSFSGLGVAR